jgi:hypothetical protein
MLNLYPARIKPGQPALISGIVLAATSLFAGYGALIPAVFGAALLVIGLFFSQKLGSRFLLIVDIAGILLALIHLVCIAYFYIPLFIEHVR